MAAASVGLTFEALRFVAQETKAIDKIAKIARDIIKLMTPVGATLQRVSSACAGTIIVFDIFNVFGAIAFFATGDYKKASWMRVAAHVNLLGISAISVVKALDYLDIVKLADASGAMAKIPFLDTIQTTIPLNAALNVLVLLMCGFSIADHAVTLSKVEGKKTRIDGKIQLWTNNVNTSGALLGRLNTAKKQAFFNNNPTQLPAYTHLVQTHQNPLVNINGQGQTYINKKIQKWNNKLNNLEISKTKSIASLICDVAKAVVVACSLALIFAGGGLPGIVTLITVLALISTSLTLANIIFDFIQRKRMRPEGPVLA
jgi:hypothetical protein